MLAALRRTAIGEVFGESQALVAGCAFGLFFGLFMGWKFRSITTSVRFDGDLEVFLSRLALHLAEVGYHPEFPIGRVFTFRPDFAAGLMAGRLTIAFENERATIVGPITTVHRLIDVLAVRRDSRVASTTAGE
ncbi:MAG TPA: hypothetical protein VN613_06590 [Gemmatimonadaceae bacterium]|nr:hypothetical protein [Gemmatimonadaceae bacterium]